VIEHIPGKDNIVADALSRLMDSAPDKVDTVKLDENLVAAIQLAKFIPCEVLDMINDAHNMIMGHHNTGQNKL
jgi:hypothetical protein